MAALKNRFVGTIAAKLCIAAWLGNAIVGLPTLVVGSSFFSNAGVQWQGVLVVAATVAVMIGVYAGSVRLSGRIRYAYFAVVGGIGLLIAAWAVMHSITTAGVDYLAYPLALLGVLVGVSWPMSDEPFDD